MCSSDLNHTAFFGLEVYLLVSFLLSRDPQLNIKTLVWEGFAEGPLGPWFRAFGCETVKIDSAVESLKGGVSILIMPEGVDATDVRNRFNVFHTGFLRMIKQYQVPIIPIGFYGVDQSIPWWVTHQKSLVEKFMKPVNPNFNFFLIPKLPILRPTKIVFNVGQPIMLTAKSLETEDKIRRKTQEIRTVIETLVDQAEAYRTEKIESSIWNRIFHKMVEGKITYLDQP